MNLTLQYKDDVRLMTSTRDMYGDIVNEVAHETKGLFLLGMSESFQNDTYTIGTDAHVYLDPTDPVIVSEGLRLEGKLLQVKGFSGKWDNYKIQRVKVGQRKLLGNEVNNVHCFLSKVDKS